MKRRRFATVLAIPCLALALTTAALAAPMTALAYDDVTDALGLQVALGSGNCSVAGNTVTLTANVRLNDTITITDGTIVLNLNGKTVSGADGRYNEWGDPSGNPGKAALCVTGTASLTIQDSGNGSITGGTGIEGAFGGGVGGEGGTGLLVSGGTVILNNGNICGGAGGDGGVGGDSDDATGGRGGDGGKGLLVSGGVVTITGGGVYGGNGAGGGVGGGNARGYGGSGGWGGHGCVAEGGTIAINGGYLCGGNGGSTGLGRSHWAPGGGGDALHTSVTISVSEGAFQGGRGGPSPSATDDGNALFVSTPARIDLVPECLAEVGEDPSNTSPWDGASSFYGYRYARITPISLPTPVNPPASSNAISGITDGQAFEQGSTVAFTAIGGGVDNMVPHTGDMRWDARSWATNPSGDFASGTTQSFSTGEMDAGNHTLTVTFVKQRYSGSAWEDVSPTVTDTKSVGYTVGAMVPRTGDDIAPLFWMGVAVLAAGALVIALVFVQGRGTGRRSR